MPLYFLLFGLINCFTFIITLKKKKKEGKEEENICCLKPLRSQLFVEVQKLPTPSNATMPAHLYEENYNDKENNVNIY